MTSMRVSSISIRRGSNDVLHANSIEIVEAFGSAIGTFARSTRARQANRFAERPAFCDQGLG
jgi:hypothetical protein